MLERIKACYVLLFTVMRSDHMSLALHIVILFV